MVPSNIYDPSFKAARKKQWCLGAGLGGGVTNIFVIYLGGGGREFFSKGIGGGGLSNVLPTT